VRPHVIDEQRQPLLDIDQQCAVVPPERAERTQEAAKLKCPKLQRKHERGCEGLGVGHGIGNGRRYGEA